MKVYDIIMKYLINNGVKDIFGVPTATISPLVNATKDFDNISYKIVKNEAAASYSAAKYAKISQNLGVCMISGSVGILNAMNGIAESSQSKSSVLIITGYVDREVQGKGAIQELEGHKILDNLVKYNKVISDADSVLEELKTAIEIANTHPKGPVHIALPRDIQLSEYNGIEVGPLDIPKVQTDYVALENTVNKINESNNGVIIVGGGCRGLSEPVKKLATKLDWRIVTTTSGKGIVEEDFPLHMGHYGFSSTDLSSEYMENADIDVILALGTQLAENSTNKFDATVFTKSRALIRIDSDKSSFGKSLNEDISVLSELEIAIPYLTENIDAKELNNAVTEPLNNPYNDNHTKVSLRKLYENITDILPSNTIYMNDIGESQQYALKYLKVPKEGDFECNINYGCMGSSIGCKGVSTIDSDRPIASFIGDGSFFMNGLSELLTAKKYNMKVIYFVVNNSCLSFVNRGHDILFGRVVEDFKDEYTDVKSLAEIMGIPSIKIEENLEIEKLKDFTSSINGPMVVEIITDGTEDMPLGRLKLLKKK